ncbi:MAG: SprT-like domain-containing protein [Gammaproteobacteria bacterium]|nr:SprT-like domain-containing protein [Gammaproteobacteria bacterium]MCP5298769.1 SprT-like domain-containing protein [Chromatiaceae bacterium]
MQQRIIARVGECLVRCAPLLRPALRRLVQPEIRFDLRGQAAGQCLWRDGHPPLLRFNLTIAERHPQEFLTTTVAHEVAHVVTAACHGRVRPHGGEWRTVMRHLGIDNPRRCHTYALGARDVRRQRRWLYQCACGTHRISTTRHNRMRDDGTRYLCQRCGTTLQRATDGVALDEMG